MVCCRWTMLSSISYCFCRSFALRFLTQFAVGGAKVGSSGLGVAEDERTEERSEYMSEGGDTVHRPIASASLLTGSTGGLPGFRTKGFGLGHGEESGVGSEEVALEVELLLSCWRKPTNWAALSRKVLGRSNFPAGSSRG